VDDTHTTLGRSFRTPAHPEILSALGRALYCFPRTVNKARQLICAIFNYGMRLSTYALPTNPAKHADRRREPDVAPLAFYSPEHVEALARALADGTHRDPSRPALSPYEIEARAREDVQDAELIRVAAYAGLRRGELVALRWRDVDFAGRKIIVRRALSGDMEVRSTKSRRAREVPLPAQAAAALERLSRRGEFTGPDDYVFANRIGRRLDPSALRRRFEPGTGRRGSRAVEVPRSPPQLRLAARRGRHRSPKCEGGDGLLPDHDY
jgi:integrase